MRSRLLYNRWLTQQEKVRLVSERALPRFLYGAGFWASRTATESELTLDPIRATYRQSFRPITGYHRHFFCWFTKRLPPSQASPRPRNYCIRPVLLPSLRFVKTALRQSTPRCVAMARGLDLRGTLSALSLANMPRLDSAHPTHLPGLVVHWWCYPGTPTLQGVP